MDGPRVLSEVSQRKKITIWSRMWNLKQTETGSDTENKVAVARGEEGQGDE